MNTPSPEPAPSKPWSRFEALLTSKEWAPEGEKMYKDQGRFNNPKAPDYSRASKSSLDLIPTLKDEKALVRRLPRAQRALTCSTSRRFRSCIGPISSTRSARATGTTSRTRDNPYRPPQIPGDRLGTKMLWQLKAASRKLGSPHVAQSSSRSSTSSAAPAGTSSRSSWR